MPSLKIVIACLGLLFASGTAARGQQYTADPNCTVESAACTAQPRLTCKQRWDAYWEEFEIHRTRVNQWPEPFVQPDRELVREPFRQMAENGWKEQNTFGDALFDDQAELNQAGWYKLRLTLTQLPPHRRVIFVLEGQTPEITGARVAAVYRHMADICHGPPSYPVYVTAIPPRDRIGAIRGGATRSLLRAAPQAAPAAGASPAAGGTSQQ